jgi:choline dehydrogenase-like flavoprotein
VNDSNSPTVPVSNSGVAVETVDVVIVGARCAGTAAAVPLARAGRAVVVLDKTRFPADTMSTHVLVPNGVQELQQMGALRKILALGPAKSKYLTLHDGDLEIRERFKPFAGIDYGLCGISRTFSSSKLRVTPEQTYANDARWSRSCGETAARWGCVIGRGKGNSRSTPSS